MLLFLFLPFLDIPVTFSLSVSQATLFQQCNSSCAAELDINEGSRRIFTFCQLWEDQNSVIDPAIDLGIQTLRDDFPPNIDFAWVKTILPGGCTDETFMRASPAAVDLQMMKSLNGCTIFVGPGCSGSIDQIRGLITKWNVPLITTEASSISRAQMAASKLVTRLGFTQDAVVFFIMKILDRFKWINVAVIYDNDTNSIGFGKTFEEYMQTLSGNVDTRNHFESRMLPLSANLAKDDYRRILKQANGTARVIIIAALPAITQDIMLTASDLDMTNGDYVYITPDLFYVSGQSGSLSWQVQPNEGGTTDASRLFARNRKENFQKTSDSASQDTKNAFQSLFVVQLKMPDNTEYLQYQNQLKDLSSKKYGYTYPKNDKFDKVLHSVMGFFDGCRLYGLALNRTLEAGENPYNGKEITEKMWNVTFHGVGTEVVISPKGDRIFDFYLMNFDAQAGEFVPAVEYIAANNSLIQLRRITWAGGLKNPPSDTPVCGFDGKSGPCAESNNQGLSPTALGLIIAASVIILAVSVGVFIYRTLKTKNINDEWWRIEWNEITQNREANIGSQASVNVKGSSSQKLSVRFDFEMSTGGSSGGGKSSSGGKTFRSSRQTQYIENGMYRDSQVAIKKIVRPVAITSNNLTELFSLRNLIHDHILRFVGICLEPGKESMIYEYCQKGSLTDILAKDTINLDWVFRFSIIHETIEGMTFLHSSSFKSHGRLKSSNILIDSRFVCKIGDIGLWNLRKPYPAFLDFESNDEEVKPLLWVAPEHLRGGLPIGGTPKGDVFSFSIILQEIILRAGPYEEQNINLDFKNIIREVRKGLMPPFRPLVPRDSCQPLLWAIMNDCWSEMPAERPTFESIKVRAKPMIKKHTGNLMDNIIKRMEKYANELEATVAERTAAFIEEKRKSEELLNQILPKVISEKLKLGERIDPETFDTVTIYHSDIVGFTALSSTSTAVEVVDLLNDLYILFDSIIEGFDAYKIETIGDAYVVASGLPSRNDKRHAAELARMSLKIIRSMRRFRVRHRPNQHLELRIGLHSGPCAAGVVGLKMPRYCVFGDTVLMAHQMEATSEPMKIHLSATTYELLRDVTDLVIEPNMEMTFGEKEPIKTYWLIGSKE